MLRASGRSCNSTPLNTVNSDQTKFTIRRATVADVPGICDVCSTAWRENYSHLFSQTYIEWVVGEFYNLARVEREVRDLKEFGGDGWLVAEDETEIVGAAGGGLTSKTEWEIFVLNLNPKRRREGIGTLLLNAMTDQATGHKAIEQWVSVTKGNEKGVPFYEAHGFRLRSS
jgi:GNAT superfamily N-acetyltransferase